jgi:Na+-driven multidrug efflux pump
MLPKRQEKSKINAWKVIWTIVGANLAMLTKQASLLLGWAYATARATRLGNEHVAAHQVAVSFWLVFALWLDGAAVAAQVLCGQSIHLRRKLKSLTSYMVKLSAAQGLIATGWLLILGRFVPYIFTTDMEIRRHLGSLIPHLAYQQPLISMTLVVESIAAGGQQFSLLAWGTALSTLAAVRQIRVATTVEDIWSRGIVLLFAGRLLTAFVGVARIVGAIPPMPFHFFNNSTRNKYEEGNDQDITEIDQ